MTIFVLSILASVVAAATVGLVRRLRHWRRLESGLNRKITGTTAALNGSTLQVAEIPPDRLVKKLITWLRSDQDSGGRFEGQFGRNYNAEHERRYHDVSAEDVYIKPRVYITTWPCYVLHRYGLEASLVTSGTRAMERLLSGQSLIRVSQAADVIMSPFRQPTLYSYRHTMRAIQLLYVVEGYTGPVQRVLGAMLSDREEWQNADGGWPQCDRVFVASDLPSSAYAAGLLKLALGSSDLPPQAREAGAVRLARTMAYLRERWDENRWAIGSVSAAENAPWFIPIVANHIARSYPDWGEELRAWVRGWTTPLGTVRAEYTRECGSVDSTTAAARLGYSLYALGAPLGEWERLYNAAAVGGEGFTAVDAAFLLEMACERAGRAARR